MNEIGRKLAGCLALGAVVGLGAAPVAVAASHHRAHSTRAVSPRKGAGFVGISSESSGKLALPVDLRVSADGRTMSRFDIQWAAACTSAAGRGSYGGLSITLNKKITAGVFSDQGGFTRTFSNGDKGLFKINLAGRFNSPGRASGTFQVTVAITDAAGAMKDNCDSNVVRWQVSD